MFFTIGFGAFFLLTGYTCLRIRTQFGTRRLKIIFTVAFALIVISLPAIEILAHSIAASKSRQFLIAGYLTLPLMLYLFLSVLAFDLLKGLNALLKVVPREALSTPRARHIALGALFLVPVAIVSAGFVNNTTIRVNPYEIQVPARSSPLKSLRVAVASDFHLREMTSRDFMPAFVGKVNSLNADILLIPGDVAEGDRSDERLEEFENQFNGVRTTYGVFATLGNHESHARGERLAFFRKSNICLLQDTAAMIDNAFVLIGRNDGREQGRMSIGDLMKKAPATLPVIVMDHKPTDLERICATRPDVLVSGHTHNGQLWPLNYIINQIYDIPWGYRKINETNIFVTSGVQVWGPPVRTTGDSEIMLITVQFK